jgi:DNA repair protein RadC
MRIYDIKLSYSLVQLGDLQTVDSPTKAVEYLASTIAEHPTQEGFYVILLDRKNHPLGRVLISLGTLTATLVHPREVFKPALIASASAVIVAHNHPSGDPAPSSADISVTRSLREAAKILEIDLLDHVIVGDPESDPHRCGFYSFREAGLL